MGRIGEYLHKRKIEKARNAFLKQLKLLQEGKIDFSKLPIPGIIGEVRGSSEERGRVRGKNGR